MLALQSPVHLGFQAFMGERTSYSNVITILTRRHKSSGAETYEDWLQRGPIYHYSFVRDASNRSTEVQVTTTFSNLPNGPGTGTGGSGLARVYCVSHFA